ncbi:MAG TPA: S41 family peptidase [Anaerolineales bacterium]|nr:S41 family peptidase [Anaerolineales bacterium]
MRRRFISSVILILSLLLSACTALQPEEEIITGEYGPAYDPVKHQTRTFDALWNHFKENYIYFETTEMNWEAIEATYRNRINEGLTNQEFTSLMDELEAQLPAESLIYQSREERIEIDSADFSTYEGIGAFVGFRADDVPHVVILAVIEGSPAEKAGLKAHDSIFAIDGNPVLLEEGLNVVNRIRGPAGSSVTLHVQTPGEEQRLIKVTRGKLTSIGKLEAALIEGTNFGYILFPPISYNGIMDDFQEHLRQFTTNRTLEGLVLDLRIAGSTTGWPLQELATLFEDGRLGEFYNRKASEVFQVSGQNLFESQTLPLVILVGQNTSGFPEILAASLQARKRAVIVGEVTPGAVETTTSYYLPNGARLFIQTTSYKLLTGEEIGLKGVLPDVLIEAGWDEVLPGKDPVLDQAIEILKASQ